jgi:hypothetical protein
MTGGGPPARSVLRRIRERQELQLAAALWHADRPMAAGWWTLAGVRGILPAGFSIATGVLVGAIQHQASLAVPLTVAGVLFIGLQVLGPLPAALSANLGDRTSAWLYDEDYASATARWTNRRPRSTPRPSISCSGGTPAGRGQARQGGSMTILVSHRFSRVRMADLIVVLDGARVAEVGSHAELMARGGRYSELCRIQAKAYK